VSDQPDALGLSAAIEWFNAEDPASGKLCYELLGLSTNDRKRFALVLAAARLAIGTAPEHELIAELDARLAHLRRYYPVDDDDEALLTRCRTAFSADTGRFDMLAHLQRQREWSERTFGPGARTKGVVDHIHKELAEIEAAPGDVSEWIDVVILALDGAWRAGFQPQQIVDAIAAKQTKNEGRTWPDWRTAPLDQAIEHHRAAPADTAREPVAWLDRKSGLATADPTTKDRYPDGDYQPLYAAPADTAVRDAPPREPTNGMLNAGLSAWERSYPGFSIDRLGDIWTAMFDAYLAPPSAPPRESVEPPICTECDAIVGHSAACSKSGEP
jgi:hypothetical protein